jgi:hypothetical protein
MQYSWKSALGTVTAVQIGGAVPGTAAQSVVVSGWSAGASLDQLGSADVRVAARGADETSWG